MRALLGALFAAAALPSPAPAADDYAHGPDSSRQEGVPQGRVEGPLLWKSPAVFEGTLRQYWIYVPAQYEAAKPAAVMVFQDGHKYVSVEQEYRVPVVFDNLIHKGEMPVTIGIFVNPGQRGETLPENAWRADNRSWEYDSLGDEYARFLIDEILPEVGRRYSLSADPAMRAIGGASSGGIAAFTVAWERPDQFRKVVSHIGSFTNIRGGHVYPALIRESAVRPIRVFLQAGSNDLDNRFGAGRSPTSRWRLRSGSAATTTGSSWATGDTPTSTAARFSRIRCAGCGDDARAPLSRYPRAVRSRTIGK
jgi:predicted alpha/beta superfamily hydrolase